MTAVSFPNPPATLCIIRLSAIGDVTHMLPFIATLRNEWPDTKITWIIGKVEYQLVKSLPGIEFLIFDKANGLSEFLTLKKKLAGRHFDVLLMMQVALRANLLSLIIKSGLAIGYDWHRARDFHSLFCNQRIDGPDRVHVLDTFFQFLEKLGIHQRQMNWLLKADQQSHKFAANIIGDLPVVAINPCSSARANNWRNWPEQNYADVINYLHKKGLEVIITGGPAKEEDLFAQGIINKCNRSPINLVGKTSLMQLLAVLEQSKFMIAPDTGPAHMGTVAGIPVIGLYASSNPLRTGPYNSQSKLMDVYPDALQKYNNKTIKQARWGERVRNPAVMQMITVELVIEGIDACLADQNLPVSDRQA